MSSSRKAVAVAVVVGAVVGATSVIANGQGSPGGQNVVQTVSASQRAEFAALRTPRTSADDLPSAVAADMQQDATISGRFAANPSLARRIAPQTWLVPGNAALCVVTAGGGSINPWVIDCTDEKQVADEGLLVANVDSAGSGTVAGVLPDGVPSVEITNARTKTRHRVKVSRSGVRIALKHGDQASLRDSAGAKRVVVNRLTTR